MRKSRFTEDQIVKILRDADREPVGQVAKRHGISEQSIYTWRRHYNELRPHSSLGYQTPCEFKATTGRSRLSKSIEERAIL